MTHRISAAISSDSIRELRESGQEPIFNVDEHKTLSEIMGEIDWSAYAEEPTIDPMFESTREPIWHLDADTAHQLIVPVQNRNRRTREEELVFEF